MHHKDFCRLPSALSGFGVFASAPILCGTVVWVPCRMCRLIYPADLKALSKTDLLAVELGGFYLEDKSLWVSCGVMPAVNHSCAANILDFGLDFCIAVKDIEAGEEITQDYRTFSASSLDSWGFDCKCSSKSCEKLISSKSKISLNLKLEWTDRVRSAINEINSGLQPLHKWAAANSIAYQYIKKFGFETVFSKSFSITKLQKNYSL